MHKKKWLDVFHSRMRTPAKRTIMKRNKIHSLESLHPILTGSSLPDEDGFQHLEKSLAPTWKLFYYSGLLFDWCAPIPKQSWKSITAHCMVIALGMTIYLQKVVLSILQIMMIVTNIEASFQRVVFSVISACMQPIIIVTWLHFIIGRAKFRAFFRDWKKFEQQGFTHFLNHRKLKRISFIIYFFYFTAGIVILLAFCAVFATIDVKTENEFIFRYYPDILDLVMFDFWLRFSHLIVVLLSLIFIPLIEIVPVLVYYHISKMINAIEAKLKSLIDPGRFNHEDMIIKNEAIRSIWSCFENLRILLSRVDNLFGPILILNHGATFFILCATIFSLLNMVRQQYEREYLPVFVVSLLFNPARLLFSFLMISKVHKAAGSLLSTVACISARAWCPALVSSSPNCVIQCFLNRLQNTKLAATPSDLYKIRPSILLTLLGLIVSYTIILLQSNH